MEPDTAMGVGLYLVFSHAESGKKFVNLILRIMLSVFFLSDSSSLFPVCGVGAFSITILAYSPMMTAVLARCTGDLIELGPPKINTLWGCVGVAWLVTTFTMGWGHI